MLPFKSIIHLDRSVRTPLYLQISNEIIKRITAGVIPVGLKLPGGRKLASLLGVSRRTVILAYEELDAQGWIQINPSQGTFVNTKIPVAQKRSLSVRPGPEAWEQSVFPLHTHLDFLEDYVPPDLQHIRYVFDTGYPDVRLAPTKALSQALNRVLTGKRQVKMLNYAADFLGNLQLRQELVKYLSETRGIKTGIDNILVTRGSLMAFTLIFRVLLAPDDKVIVGATSFKVANKIIRIAGGQLVTVPIDEWGLDVDAIEKCCKQQTIRAVFVMPHHHHPTTVSLSAERRVKLLRLAEKYCFAIIEDDYDYDFHYASSPLLPMASADRKGTVVYVGSLSKTVAPGLRTGFIVAPENLIKELARLSRFMDCHGNTALEKAIALLFQEGIIRRHLKKALKTYHRRRDLFCQLLQDALGDYLTFKIPEGGLAVWVTFDESIPLSVLRASAFKRGLIISKTVFQAADGKDLNAIRMGFASLSEAELVEAVELLKRVVEQVYPTYHSTGSASAVQN